MRATLFIDGRLMGEIDYAHPKDSLGKTIPIPTASDEYQSEAYVVIRDDDGNAWMGKMKLERLPR